MIVLRNLFRLRVPCLAALLALAAGCMGGAAPSEHYLRLVLAQPAECAQQAVSEKDCAKVAIKDLDSLAGLDRTAVMLAKGPVLTSSTVWYWEGPPTELLGQALAERLNCSPSLRSLRPYTPRLAHDAVLTGQVLSFEVLDDLQPKFRLRFHLNLWSERGLQLLADRTFESTTPIPGLTPSGIARGSGEAVSNALDRVAAWLEAQGLKGK